MKKILPQIVVGIICAMLGFLVSYEIKYIVKNSADENTKISNNDEALQKLNELQVENDKLTEDNKKLSEQVKSYENSIETSDADNEARKQIMYDKAALGLEDVNGSGIVITIQNKNATYDNNLNKISEEDLSYIINNLKFAGAEAISINDIRITSQTGIRTSGSFIRIGSTERINPNDPIIIKAIGDSTKLKTEMEFQGFLDTLVGNNYSTSISVNDDISIEKSANTILRNFIRLDE